jgi:hypothetical protein
VTTAEVNDLARQTLIKIIVNQLQKGVRRRFGVGLSPKQLWRDVHKHSK